MTKNRILWFGFHEFHRGYLWYHKITISGIAWWPPDYPYLALWSHYYPIYPLVSSGYLTVRHGKWPSYRWFTYQKWWLALTNLLVGGIPTPLKNMSSSDWIIIPTIGENKKCSKPPTRYPWYAMIYDIWYMYHFCWLSHHAWWSNHHHTNPYD